jgi:hypothetical protein
LGGYKITYASPSSINASKGIGEILSYVNTQTDSWISNLLLLAIFIIVLLGFYKAKDDFRGAMAVSGYATLVVAIFFWIGGFVSSTVFAISLGVAILGTLFLLLDNN